MEYRDESEPDADSVYDVSWEEEEEMARYYNKKKAVSSVKSREYDLDYDNRDWNYAESELSGVADTIEDLIDTVRSLKLPDTDEIIGALDEAHYFTESMLEVVSAVA